MRLPCIKGAVGRTVVQKHDVSRIAENNPSGGLRHATGVTVQPQPPLKGRIYTKSF